MNNTKPHGMTKVVVQRRNKQFDMYLYETVVLGLQMDTDVYEKNNPSNYYVRNADRYKCNSDFKDAKELNKWMRERGKIRGDLELRMTDTKGYGVFALKHIKSGEFLGFYEGLYRQFIPKGNPLIEHIYAFHNLNVADKPDGVMDAENLIFSNWTRFINDDDTHNVRFDCYNHAVYVWACEDIKPGDELTGPYGDLYWKNTPKHTTPVASVGESHVSE